MLRRVASRCHVGIVANRFLQTSAKAFLAAEKIPPRSITKAKNYRYIGGYYGGSTMLEMMHELMTNGPVVVSFEPSEVRG